MVSTRKPYEHPVRPDTLQAVWLGHILNAAFSMLPFRMYSPEAVQMLLAIGWQESRFQHREQVGGPARGFWQFEKGGGVVGVLRHKSTKKTAVDVLETLQYLPNPDAAQVYAALAHNDVLAAAFARLLLFASKRPMPLLTDAQAGWTLYQEQWRPGKPHPETWLRAWGWAEAMRHTIYG